MELLPASEDSDYGRIVRKCVQTYCHHSLLKA